MEDNTVNKVVPDTVADDARPQFNGYSLDDIRYRRALVALQKEFAKQKIVGSVKKIQRHSPFSSEYVPSRGGALGKAGMIAGKLLTGLNYIDYAILGFSLFNSGKKIFRFFRRK